MEETWRPILHSSNQLVLYNPTSHALAIQSSAKDEQVGRRCFYCKQLLPAGLELDAILDDSTPPTDTEADNDPVLHSRAPNYFQLLEMSNVAASRPPSPPPAQPDAAPHAEPSSTHPGAPQSSTFPPESMAQGYFKAFFREESRLGMGANGSVFLCQHMLDGIPLGHFAVKKIAVGESHSYLLKTLREVKLLERLRHPNVISYHHAWLESSQFSSFGPTIPTLYILMQWAEGGSLDDFIDVRLGRGSAHVHMHPHSLSGHVTESRTGSELPYTSPMGVQTSPDETLHASSGVHSRSARIRAFRAFQRAPPEEKDRLRRQQLAEMNGAEGQSWTAVHLCSAEEVKSLFSDIVNGLAFLHSMSILHLDLKAGNVLLTWDEGKLIPRAMISDFGTSRDMVSGSKVRTGNTGTLEYSSPESLPNPQSGILGAVDSKSDLWSLGMILHKILFFYLPYRYAADGDVQGQPLSAHEEPEKLAKLEQEVLNYPGFRQSSKVAAGIDARRLPRTYLVLLEGLLNVTPSIRPSCERIASAIKEGKLDPVRPSELHETGSLIPILKNRVYPQTQEGASSTNPSPDAPEHVGSSYEPRSPAKLDSSLQPLPSSNSHHRLIMPGPPVIPISSPNVTRRPWWHTWMPTAEPVRVAKTLILTLKLLSLPLLRDPPSLRGSNTTSLLSTLAVGLAFIDTSLIDNWLTTGALSIIHLGMLGFALVHGEPGSSPS